MTDKDIVKDLVKEVLQENPELVRQQGIAKDRARMEDYLREISAPAQPRSPVDSYDALVKQTDVEMPLQTVFYNSPAPSDIPPANPGTGSDSFDWTKIRLCAVIDDVDTLVVKLIPTRDIP